MGRARVSACRRRSSWSGTARPTGTQTTASRARGSAAQRDGASAGACARDRVTTRGVRRPVHEPTTACSRDGGDHRARAGTRAETERCVEGGRRRFLVGADARRGRAALSDGIRALARVRPRLGRRRDDDELGARVVTGLTRIGERHDGGGVLAIRTAVRSAPRSRSQSACRRRGASLNSRHGTARRQTRLSGRQTRASRLTASWRTARAGRALDLYATTRAAHHEPDEAGRDPVDGERAVAAIRARELPADRGARGVAGVLSARSSSPHVSSVNATQQSRYRRAFLFSLRGAARPQPTRSPRLCPLAREEVSHRRAASPSVNAHVA